MNISELIQTLAKTSNKDFINFIECTVSSVDEDNRTCTVMSISKSYEGEIESVYLSAQPNDGIIQIPEINSIVKVCICSSIDYPFIIQFSDLSKIELLGNQYLGLVKVQPLVDKINALENKVNSIINTYNTHTHPYINVVTPANTSATTGLVTGTITPITQVSDLENTAITHG